MALDKDGDGDISLKEMKFLLKSLKTRLRMSETEINRLLKQFDQNGDGTIDLEEFLQHISQGTKRDVIQKALIQRNGIRQLFNKYDKDGNGKITRDEFRKIAEDKFQAKLTPKQIDDLMKQADYNNDGTLDYEEYVKAFSYMPVTD